MQFTRKDKKELYELNAIPHLPVNKEEPNIIDGMGSFLTNIKSISRIDPRYSNNDLTELSFIKSMSPMFMLSIRNFLSSSQANYVDTDDIKQYLSIKGMGLSRVIYLYYAITGNDSPYEIVEQHIFKTDFFINGWHGSYENAYGKRSPLNGGTILHRDLAEMFVNETKAIKNQTFDELLSKVPHVDMGDGFITYKQYAIAEKGLLGLASRTMETIGEYVEDEDALYPPTEEQTIAIKGVLDEGSQVNMLVGSAGTGKSVTIASIIRSLYVREGFTEQNSKDAIVLAPTGTASKRVAMAGDLPIGRVLSISTIHSFAYKVLTSMDSDELEDVANTTLVVVDETSMLDTSTFYLLLRALLHANKETFGQDSKVVQKLLLVGDVEQLPPVGAGRIFQDMVMISKDLKISSPTFELTKVLRTTDTDLLDLFDSVRNNKLRDFNDIVKKFQVNTRYNHLEKLLGEIVADLSSDGDKWWRHTSFISLPNRVTKIVNDLMYERLTDNHIVNGAFTPWQWVGAKVVFTENNSEVGVVNGDVGEVTEIDKVEEEVKVELYCGTQVSVPYMYLSVQLGFAVTCHKSQGSEYKDVFFIHNNTMESRRLVYTAITRAKENLAFINVGDSVRWSSEDDVPTILGYLSQ